MMKKMKKFETFCLCMMAVAVLGSGCGKQEEVETTAPETTTAEAETEIPEGTVKLGNYLGLEISEPDTTVTDEQVENQIYFVLSSNPEIVEITDRPAQDGDIVNIDFVGRKDGVAFEGGTSAGYDLELGSGSFIDGFEDGIVGANVGDKLSLNLTFPENYGNEELAGQEVVFDVTVNAISEQKEAELNDEFVQKVSKDSKTVEEYREEVRKTLEENAAENAKIQKQNDVMDLILSSSTFENLDAQVDAEMEMQMEQLQEALEQSGMTFEDYASMFGMDEEGFRDYIRSDIEESLKVTLIAKEIALVENLEVDDAARLEVAAAYGLDSPDELVKTYGQDAVDQAARNVMVMNFLVENAKILEEE